MSRVVLLPRPGNQPRPAAPAANAPDVVATASIVPVPPRRLPLPVRLGALAAVAVVLLVLLGVLGNSTIDALRLQSDRATHASRVKEQVQLTYARLKEAESASRGLVLLGDNGFDGRFRGSAQEMRRAAALLRTMVADNDEQAKNAATLQHLLGMRLQQLEAVIASWRKGGVPAAQSRMADNLALPQVSAIEALVAHMAAIEDSLLAQRAARAEESERRLRLFGPLVISLCVLLLGFTGFVVLREQARRTRAEARLQASQRELERSLEEARSSARWLAQLGELGDLLQGCRSIDEAMEVLRAIAPRLLGIDAGDVYFGREGEEDFTRIGGWGNPGAAARNAIARGDCWAVRRGHMFPASDSTVGVCCPHVDARGGRHHVCVPLSAQGESHGVLVLEHRERLTPVQRRLLRSMAEQLSLALANLRLQESLRSQSIRDALTGLYNRRYLDASMAREVARAERHEQELSMLIVDIDHFKRINDTFGHDAGDTVLAQVAAVLDLGTRGEDIACRYGGEEFVVLMPGADARSALRRAEELRTAIAGSVATYAGRSIGPVTVSIGVATFP
ncbi:MAG TPA: diguanylate cyclase, partial [Xanthomonadales bacterium]|nr:diguanylate cyclase [Xanthomonadales bacterium]